MLCVSTATFANITKGPCFQVEKTRGGRGTRITHGGHGDAAGHRHHAWRADWWFGRRLAGLQWHVVARRQHNGADDNMFAGSGGGLEDTCTATFVVSETAAGVTTAAVPESDIGIVADGIVCGGLDAPTNVPGGQICSFTRIPSALGSPTRKRMASEDLPLGEMSITTGSFTPSTWAQSAPSTRRLVVKFSATSSQTAHHAIDSESLPSRRICFQPRRTNWMAGPRSPADRNRPRIESATRQSGRDRCRSPGEGGNRRSANVLEADGRRPGEEPVDHVGDDRVCCFGMLTAQGPPICSSQPRTAANPPAGAAERE